MTMSRNLKLDLVALTILILSHALPPMLSEAAIDLREAGNF